MASADARGASAADHPLLHHRGRPPRGRGRARRRRHHRSQGRARRRRSPPARRIATLSDEGRERHGRPGAGAPRPAHAEYDANKRLIDKGQAPTQPAAGARGGGRRGPRGARRGAGRGRPLDHPLADRRHRRRRCRCRSARPSSSAPRSPRSSIPTRCSPSARSAKRERGSLEVGQAATVRFIDGTQGRPAPSTSSASAPTRRRAPTRSRRAWPTPTRAIADGVTCEMVVTLAPIEAASVPRSALVFSDDGQSRRAHRRRREQGAVRAGRHRR